MRSILAGLLLFGVLLLGLVGCDQLKGQKGDIGLMGEKGEKGNAGEAGSTGATGATGATGSKGDTGATGAKGDTGTSTQLFTGYIPSNGIVLIGSGTLNSKAMVTVMYEGVPGVWAELGEPTGSNSASLYSWAAVNYSLSAVYFYNCSTSWQYKILVVTPTASAAIAYKKSQYNLDNSNYNDILYGKEIPRQ